MQKPELIKQVHDMRIIKSLLELLNSSSFTVVANSLGALNQFAAFDPLTQKKLLQNTQAMTFLNGLRNSVREDVRNSAKSVLNHLNCVNFVPYSSTLPSSSRYTGRAFDVQNPFDPSSMESFRMLSICRYVPQKSKRSTVFLSTVRV